jgi:hypothetical protein
MIIGPNGTQENALFPIKRTKKPYLCDVMEMWLQYFREETPLN